MPENIPLTVEELESLALKCTVCGGDIPPERARRRNYSTCSKEHGDILRQRNKHLLRRRRCNSCLAPYTEKQRAEFKRWRKSTGQLREKAGRPAADESVNQFAMSLGKLTSGGLSEIGKLVADELDRRLAIPVTPEEQETKVVDTIQQDSGIIQANVPT